MNRKEAIQAERTYFGTIDQAVEYLEKCKKNGKNVYVDFGVHRLYSSDVTIDNAYMEVLGMTKEEDRALIKEYGQAKTGEERKAIIEKGESIKRKYQEETKKSATRAKVSPFSFLLRKRRYR